MQITPWSMTLYYIVHFATVYDIVKVCLDIVLFLLWQCWKYSQNKYKRLIPQFIVIFMMFHQSDSKVNPEHRLMISNVKPYVYILLY